MAVKDLDHLKVSVLLQNVGHCNEQLKFLGLWLPCPRRVWWVQFTNLLLKMVGLTKYHGCLN